MSSTSSPWILRLQPRLRAGLRLFCFPHAGGAGSSYRLWPAGLPPDVEVLAVQPPGREGRWREAVFTELPPLVNALADALAPELGSPFAFFGHSLGALVSFELARHLQRERGIVPEVLVVSGRPVPSWAHPEERVTHLPERQFVDAVVRQYNAIPQAVLEDEELRRMFVRVLRSDLQISESYRYEEGPKLRCPIVAYGGDEDPFVPLESLAQWGQQTERSFSSQVFHGGHFFLHALRDEFLVELSNQLRPVVVRAIA